ncbi:hypothetical protein JVT61DRAFT_773 [Boletus reticuloceps]|uniref:Uncharacterized protein n=1 Tax=Boletus reticuloceps TaxID=495285 RepID=A0A8I3AGZ5_9AGAM|nr:hypothetical protein JVT61DRAFT_773 [Boletus reticuloceps]
MSSGFFSTVDGDSWADNFPTSSDEIAQDFQYLRPMFSTSPEQLPTPLPDPDPSFPPIYSIAHRAPPSPNSHALFDFHARPLQTDNPSNYDYTRFGPVSTIPQPYTTLNAGPSLQRYSSSLADAVYQLVQVMNDPFPVHDTLYYSQDHSTYAHSYCNGSQAFVDQTKGYHPAMGIPYQQIQSSPTGMAQIPSAVPPYLPFQPMVSRSPQAQVPLTHQNSQGNHSITGSPYHPIRTSSLPVQSASPKEMMIGTCKWIGDDGTVCGTQIAYATVPEHLATHGIKKMTGNFRLQCRWLECRLRGDRKEMNRESIVRHVREMHLGRKRTL